ncbi:MAG: glycosyltransferase [Candidatus Bathyarchaeota archaeon]|nr:glycosyltransferase [Candidatus Bathyarchaeota archaeon]
MKAPSMGQIDLSFVIPAYNEEFYIVDTLGSLDSAVKNKRIDYEIVVVDDGSQDKTYQKALQYAKRNGHVKVIRYARNSGKGFAIKTGVMQSTGDVVIFIDGDMEIALNTISTYVNALDKADIVIASKWHPDSQVWMPLTRKLLSRTFNVLVRTLIDFRLKDTQVGLKVMKRSAVNAIFPRLAVKRYAFDVELLAVARLYGLKITQMPVKIKLASSFKTKEVSRMFLDLLGIAYRLKVIRWYQRQMNTNGSSNK